MAAGKQYCVISVAAQGCWSLVSARGAPAPIQACYVIYQDNFPSDEQRYNLYGAALLLLLCSPHSLLLSTDWQREFIWSFFIMSLLSNDGQLNGWKSSVLHLLFHYTRNGDTFSNSRVCPLSHVHENVTDKTNCRLLSRKARLLAQNI